MIATITGSNLDRIAFSGGATLVPLIYPRGNASAVVQRRIPRPVPIPVVDAPVLVVTDSTDMSLFDSLFAAILQTEENIIPLFVHSPGSQTIAAVILASEASVFAILQRFHTMKAGAVPPAASTGPIPAPVVPPAV